MRNGFIAGLAVLCLVSSFSLSGCQWPPRIYRMDIEQGNMIEKAKVDQLKVGMTKQEVHKLMGTHLAEDHFKRDHWIYYYHLSPGMDQEHPTEKKVTLHFERNKLKRYQMEVWRVPS